MTAAPSYLHGHRQSVLAAHAARTADDAAAFLLPHLRSPMNVLDVGCGPGTITVGLADAVAPGGRVTGIDLSDALRPEWEKRLADAGSENLEFRTADLFASDLPAAHYDAVYMHQVLQHMPAPVEALRAAASYAKDGGLLAVREVDWGTFVAYPSSDALLEFRRIYDAVARGNGGDPHAGRQLRKWCQDAGGLTDIQVTTSTWSFYDDAGREWWANQWSERIVDSNIADSALAHGIATAEELRAIAEGWQHWKNQPGAVSAFVHFEALARVARE